MFYGRLRFYCILIVYAKLFMFTLFLLYLVRNDNDKELFSTVEYEVFFYFYLTWHSQILRKNGKLASHYKN